MRDDFMYSRKECAYRVQICAFSRLPKADYPCPYGVDHFPGFWECPFLFPGRDRDWDAREFVAPYGDGGIVIGCAYFVVCLVWWGRKLVELSERTWTLLGFRDGDREAQTWRIRQV